MRVLIVKTSSMGDVIHTLPAVSDALAAVPNIVFDWAVEEAFQEIPSWHEGVDQVIPVAIRRWRKNIFRIWKSAEWRGFKNEIKHNHYDCVIDAQGLIKSAWVTRLVKAPSCGYDWDSIREKPASLVYHRKIPVSKNLHAVERIRHLFARALEYDVPEQAGNFGLSRQKFRASTPDQHPGVVFLHGTTMAEKHWPEAYWVELCERVTSEGHHVYIPWYTETEKKRAKAIASVSDKAMVLPKLNLQGLANVLAESLAFVAVDTGLGHLAAALDVPGVSLYGPTNPGLIGTYGTQQVHLASSEQSLEMAAGDDIEPRGMAPLRWRSWSRTLRADTNQYPPPWGRIAAMKLAFTLYKYFPYGGLQRDMMAIARICVDRGHEVTILCREWSGQIPEDIKVRLLRCGGKSNHKKNGRFHGVLQKKLAEKNYDRVIAFDKIPGADIYYAADTCFQAKTLEERPWFYRYMARYRFFMEVEQKIFGTGSSTRILALAQRSVDEYRKYYNTPAERFTLLPPGISRDRINTNSEPSYLLHDELDLEDSANIVLFIGSGFATKGLDRAIRALSSLSNGNHHLAVVGLDSTRDYRKLAKKLGVRRKVHFLGGRTDVPELLKCGRLLIHPAYRENTGTVLLEAAVAGLPVVCTEVCGYSGYIRDNQLGVVVDEPFSQKSLDDALKTALTDDVKHRQWQDNCRRFTESADIYDLHEKAADEIER
jgi:heptosyltransferase-1